MNSTMKKLKEALEAKKSHVIPYLTPDFPLKGVTEKLASEFDRLGIKIMELGIPYSDPLADGETIQQASAVAIKNGVDVRRVLEIAKQISESTKISVILMGYFNQMLQFGFEKFLIEAKHSGVQGIIIPDLPQDECMEYKLLGDKYDIAFIFLVAPTSSQERIKLISERSSLFSYCVSMNGVTGKSGVDYENLKNLTTHASANHEKPFVVGFGLSTPDDIRFVTKLAKGAVIGSALLKSISNAKNSDEAVLLGMEFMRPLSEVVNE